MKHKYLFLTTSEFFETSLKSSGVFKKLQKSLDIVALSSKILAVPREKSFVFEVEKVGRYTSRADLRDPLFAVLYHWLRFMKMNDGDDKYVEDDT